MKKIKVAVVRGRHLNNFEMQFIEPLQEQIDLIAFASLTGINHKYDFPVIRLASPIDIVYELNRFGVSVRYGLGVLNRIFVDAQYLVGLENQLKGFDIAHTADTYYHYTIQCLNAKKKGWVKKVVATIWENIPFNNEGIRGRHEFKQRANREVDLFIAMTHQAKDALITEGCDPNKIKVVYPGLDLERFPMKKKQAKQPIKLLFVGRLVAEKGIWLTYEVFKKLKKDNKKLQLRICGDGPEKIKLQRAIHQDRLTNSIIIKPATYEEMPQVYQGADLMLNASSTTKYWKEQFGMVLIEAMASGVPIITTDTGAIAEVVGDAGVLVPHKDINSYTTALNIMLTSEVKRNALVKKGRDRVEKLFNRNMTSQNILRCYQDVFRN